MKIGDVVLGGAPRIAVPLYDDDPAGDVASVRGLADLIELRIDCFGDPSVQHVCAVIGRLRDLGSPPLIATVRWQEEGGQAALADDQRLALYEAVAPLVDAVDVELHAPIAAAVLDVARRLAKPSIASFHDFRGLPPFYDLEGLRDEADAAGADILKVAVTPASLTDVRRLLEYTLRHRDRGLVTIALGDIGAISRIVFPLAGSLFTFAYHRTPSGPGQLPLREMRAEIDKYFPR